MRQAFWAALAAVGVLTVTTAPAFAQMRISQPQRASGAVTAYSTTKPSGAIGVFGWYPFLSAGAVSAAAPVPGLAANLWFTPNLSFGVWGVTGAFPGYGNITSADLEGKVKFFQSGTDAFSWALTATGGAKFLSYSPGTGVGLSLGLIADWYLPQRFVAQGRLGYTPLMSLAGANRQVLDGKLGLGYAFTDMVGLDVGLRTQNILSGPDLYQLTGPYLGLGFVF